MLGINQTMMFALFMVIFAAFIGTKDLGQEIFRALTFADTGVACQWASASPVPGCRPIA